MMWRVETKAEVEVGSSGGDEAGGVGDATGEGGADKSAAYLSSLVVVVSPMASRLFLINCFAWYVKLSHK